MLSQDVCLSVYLSVYHTAVYCRNGSTYHQTFSPSCSHVILVFAAGNRIMAMFRRGVKKSRFSTNISLHLRIDYTRYDHSYYRRRMGNRTQAFLV